MRFVWLIVALVTFGWGPTYGDEAPPLKFKVARFQVEGTNPLDQAATDAALAPFLGEYASVDGLLAAKDALEQAFAAAGFSFHRATLPPQDLNSGVVTLKVSSYNVGDVKISGNQHFTTDNIRASLPKIVAGAPNLNEVTRSLAVANEHPHKKLRLTLRDSDSKPDSLDAVVNVQDQRPWNVFGGINNIGTSDTGELRSVIGGTYSNLTHHDDVFSTSVTFSPDNFNNVLQFGAFYQLPIYSLSGWLSAFYVKSDVNVGNVANFFDVSGSGDFLGLSFKRQLLGMGRYRHSYTISVQDRDFDTAISNAVTGIGIAGISNEVRSRPLSARYDGSFNWPATFTSLDFYVDFTLNMPFGANNSNAAYLRLRPTETGPVSFPGASADWKLIRFGGLLTQALPRDFSGVVRLNGQYTNDSLIPGEQFGIGGERSVRGFEERALAGDRGAQLSFEAWSPPVERLQNIRFLGFYDWGVESLQRPFNNRKSTEKIDSIGLGARWQWNDMVNLSLDYGIQLDHASKESQDKGNNKWHVNLQVRY